MERIFGVTIIFGVNPRHDSMAIEVHSRANLAYIILTICSKIYGWA